MPTKIVDLDVVLGEDKEVRLGGKVYRLPADLPVELWLRISSASEQNLTEQEMVALLYEGVLKLFQYGDPGITSIPVGMGQLAGIIGQVYGEGEAEEPRPTRTNGASPRRSRPKRSRSSTS